MGVFSVLSVYLFVILSATWCTIGDVSIERFSCICAIWLMPVLATSVFSSIIAKGMTCHSSSIVSSSIVLFGTVLGCYVTLAHEAIFQRVIEAIRLACTSTAPVAVPVIMGSALYIGGVIGSSIVISVGAVEMIVAVFSVSKPRINLAPLRIPLLTFITGSILELFVRALIPLFPK
jgi:hypothetical protein